MLVIVLSLLHSKSKVFAALLTIGINSNGSFVPEVRVLLQRIGAGMKIEEPSKLMRLFLLGAAILATSSAVL